MGFLVTFKEFAAWLQHCLSTLPRSVLCATALAVSCASDHTVLRVHELLWVLVGFCGLYGLMCSYDRTVLRVRGAVHVQRNPLQHI